MGHKLSFSPAVLTKPELAEGCIGRLWHYHNTGNQGVLHRHPEIEWALVLAGTGTCLVGSSRYRLDPGTLLWVPSNVDHVLSEKSAQLEMWIGVVQPEAIALPQLAPSCKWPALSKRLPARQAQQIAMLFDEVAAISAPPLLFNAGLTYSILRAWEFHHQSEQSLPDAALHASVQQAIQWICEETDSLPIPELARAVGLSPSRFNEVFKADTGQTPVEFRNRQRIERFLRLYGTHRNMLAAAYEAGFGSYPQFFRAFTRVMGCSPARYRRQAESGLKPF